MHSIAFEIGGFTLYWYGILTAFGFFAAFWLANRNAVRSGLSMNAIPDLAPWLIGGAVVGARLLYVISYWNEDFAGKPLWEIFMLRRSGLVYYGGLIGASLATVFYCWWKKYPLWKMADCITPGIALGHGFGRIGCLMTGCCYGRPTDLPWAIHFPHDHWTHGVGVHPTQIYESGLNFALFGFLAWVLSRKKFDGQVFAVYLMCYAVVRSFVELFRGDYTPAHIVAFLTPGQLVSIGTFAAGAFLIWKLGRIKLNVQPIVGQEASGKH